MVDIEIRQVRRMAMALILLVVLAGCTGDGGGDPSSRIRVVATTTVLGDVVSNIVGTDADVEVLMPIGGDPHDYQPSSKEVAAIYKADLVVAVGMGLEESLVDVLDVAASEGANILELAPLVSPIPGSDGTDAHFWLDPVSMAEAVVATGGALAAVDPSVDWASRAATYAAMLLELEEELEVVLQEVPESKRVMVTNHDSFAHFEHRYGYEVVGVLVSGGSTHGVPSSEELAALVEMMRSREVRAVFADATEPTTLADAIVAEAGANIAVVELHTGSLGAPGSGAETYEEMLRSNAVRIADALRRDL